MLIRKIRSTQSQKKRREIVSESITQVGLDVHKTSIVIALAGMKDHYRRDVG
jgi:hypothetical protein